VGVVEPHAVAALAGASAAGRGGEAEASLIVIRAVLPDLDHLEPVAPQRPILGRGDELHELVVVADGEGLRVAEGEVPEVGHVHRPPLPGWPEHVQA
jgi:hypothetical protein